MTSEEKRLAESSDKKAHWKRWGPYLSDRAWGTVREDYSPGGTAWEYLPHDHARSRAYRWNEDGIGGICDRHQRICFALGLWNGRDAILKERLFGLTGNQGNHGEDVKECYYYLDSTPTHSYMKMLYKYPQAAFPYSQLVEENRRRGRGEGEFDLPAAGVFHESRYFDVVVEYAKATPEDILIRITAHNRGPEAAVLHLLPTVWFRNTWSWNRGAPKPSLERERARAGAFIRLDEPYYGQRWLACDAAPELLFTENNTNYERLFNASSASPFVKDAFGRYLIENESGAVNPEQRGTKAAAHYSLHIEAGGSAAIRLRLCDRLAEGELFGALFEEIFAARLREADDYYCSVTPTHASPAAKQVMRQAFAGLFWSKQFYHFVVQDWLSGDPGMPAPPERRLSGRNTQWRHLYNADVISMPDKWEYPWYAAWDLAFHCIPISIADCDFAKEQLILLLREWYMHPNGQLPAYEWAFGDVNPPVHAWAAWRVYKIEQKRRGQGDTRFLERVFHKLMLNFTWWVNRKDAEGRNVFQGGFLGLDNIGLFDRSSPLPTGGHLEQADGTGWMAMYCLNLLAIALELARTNPAYEDVASKFWEHFLYIAHAINHIGSAGTGMWDEEDGFFYDVLHTPEGGQIPLKVRSMVGLIPLFAVETLEPGLLAHLPDFGRRLNWFIQNRPDLTANVASMEVPGEGERKLLSILDANQLRRVLRYMLDENEFLSPYGVRSVSRFHKEHPFIFGADGKNYCVDYEPAESETGLFGGNSNWRGPIWFPLNYLLIESLQKLHHYYGDSFRVECPYGSGNMMNLEMVAAELSRRLASIFLPKPDGTRPVNGQDPLYASDPHWRDLILFCEYFNGDTGEGLGASHQTGWTALVAKLIQQSGS